MNWGRVVPAVLAAMVISGALGFLWVAILPADLAVVVSFMVGMMLGSVAVAVAA